MKRAMVVGVVLFSLAGGVLGQSPRRQTQELRQALRKVVADIVELNREETAVLKRQKELLEALPPRDPVSRPWPRIRTVQRMIEVNEGSAREQAEELREQIEDYTDLELPGLAVTIRAVHAAAKRSLKEQRTQLKVIPELAEEYRREQKAAAELAAKKRASQKPIEEIRSELAKEIDEIDALGDLWILTLEAIRSAHTDKWERRWAGDRVRTAKRTLSGGRDTEWLRDQLKQAKEDRRALRTVARYVRSEKAGRERKIGFALKSVEALGGKVPTASAAAAAKLELKKSAEEIRAVLSEKIDEVGTLHAKWAETMKAVEAAQTDKWEKRWTRDAVRMALPDMTKRLKHLRGLLDGALPGDLGYVKSRIEGDRVAMEAKIEKARKKVEALGGSVPTE